MTRSLRSSIGFAASRTRSSARERDVFAPETLPPGMQTLLLRSEIMRLEPAPRSIYGNASPAAAALAT